MRVGVIGGGQMGAGIAEVCARSGVDVTVVEADEAGVERARAAIERSLDRAVRSGKASEEDKAAALDHLVVTSVFEDLEGADAAIEAVVENEALKRDVFRRLDELLPDAQFLASNTSSVPIMKLGAETKRPGRVLGMHFFNPVPVLPLVELVTSIMTEPETVESVRAFAEGTLGKQCIDSQDRAGFVVNALLIPYLLSAIRMYESGFASKEDIDQGMVLGCAHPMGPLRLSDLIGLDTLLAVAESLHDEFRDPASVSPALLNRMVEAGLLGRKTGRGFYDYSK
ncbi:3-hydroxybutyryl-CoA dehydrogenase [Solirubrobacter sp. CPCC 204708]|uniref:3-hydroxybutyryl-CoA dehydrogenase n=1 Tax=Solirubrobacter deserti TaxID=2282478 RepID=A0ABT4RJP9_9ACTN|nr:3-hydroxybutyryl-CoA dehydrogenase [Solirubrobacter deserti]MBE2319791.1 3-hydroxybutyryl-CoA dehydrogenase [Solirubrobacter deserti]MDA0138725.1 3-hydroxybutyryl-CoA dehydrogenase [Solirubrobacter deserti]